jgi:hypothetical protein
LSELIGNPPTRGDIMACNAPGVVIDPLTALRLELAELRAEFDALDTRFKHQDFDRLRERIAHLEALLSPLGPAALRQEVAVLRAEVGILKEWRERTELKARRLWLGIGICAVATALTVLMHVSFYLLFEFK